jgi:hypothetical protein
MTHMCFKNLVTIIDQSIRISCILIKVAKKGLPPYILGERLSLVELDYGFSQGKATHNS